MLRVRFPSVVPNPRQILKHQSLLNKNQQVVPKGHIAVYVGEAKKTRYVVPIAYLCHPAFESLLKRAEEEFGYYHPMGGLTIPCNEEEFISLASQLLHDKHGKEQISRGANK